MMRNIKAINSSTEMWSNEENEVNESNKIDYFFRKDNLFFNC